MKRGSALIVALWVIAILSVMVLSFANEAHLQTGINVFVRERNRVSRLVDAGKTLAEILIVGFSKVSDWSKEQDDDSLLEDDRWYLVKQDLKGTHRKSCVVGPILVDEARPESGTVTVEISMDQKLNINELTLAGDSNYRMRWEMILISHGIPEEYEVEAWDGSHQRRTKMKLIDLLIASWNDWCDEDDVVTASEDGVECGAESAWYEEEYEDAKIDDEFRRFPRNSSIPDIKELAYIRGFRDYPQILTGGYLPAENEHDEPIPIRGIADMFGVTGSAKINVNSPELTPDLLLTIPGIFDEESVEDQSEALATAKAIIDGRNTIMPEDRDVDETLQDGWPYVDMDDIVQRSQEADPDAKELDNQASQYLVFKPDDTTLFDIKITCQSMGTELKVRAKAYVKNNEVRYVEWEENPKE